MNSSHGDSSTSSVQLTATSSARLRKRIQPRSATSRTRISGRPVSSLVSTSRAISSKMSGKILMSTRCRVQPVTMSTSCGWLMPAQAMTTSPIPCVAHELAARRQCRQHRLHPRRRASHCRRSPPPRYPSSGAARSWPRPAAPARRRRRSARARGRARAGAPRAAARRAPRRVSQTSTIDSSAQYTSISRGGSSARYTKNVTLSAAEPAQADRRGDLVQQVDPTEAAPRNVQPPNREDDHDHQRAQQRQVVVRRRRVDRAGRAADRPAAAGGTPARTPAAA